MLFGTIPSCRKTLPRLLPLSLSVVVFAAFLSGCGGGGSGSGGSSGPGVQTFSDDFSTAALDQGTWGVYGADRQLQLTQFGFEPQMLQEGGTSFARFRLDTYNPSAPGRLFKGSQIFTHNYFRRGNGLEVKARLRGPNLPPGIVFAFFMINDRYLGAGTPENYRKTEIDYEFLSAEQEQFSPAGQRKRLYLNIWNDWNQIADGFDGNINPDTTRQHDDLTYQPSTTSGFDWATWNTYAIRWYPDRTEYWVNNHRERVESQVLPDEDMTIDFDIWSPSPDFSRAFSSSFRPTSNASQNKSYFFDVDSVQVTPLG